MKKSLFLLFLAISSFAEICSPKLPIEEEIIKKVLKTDCEHLIFEKKPSFPDELAGAIVTRDRASMVELLEHNATITPVHMAMAIGTNDLDAVKRMVQAGYNVNRPLNTMSMLFLAVQHADIDMIGFLLQSGADVNAKTAGDNTALNALVSNPFKPNGAAIAQLLIASGADVNAAVGYYGPISSDYKGTKAFTPLHNAVANGNYRAAELLLEHGADPEAVNDAGMRARDFVHFMEYSPQKERFYGLLFDQVCPKWFLEKGLVAMFPLLLIAGYLVLKRRHPRAGTLIAFAWIGALVFYVLSASHRLERLKLCWSVVTG